MFLEHLLCERLYSGCFDFNNDLILFHDDFIEEFRIEPVQLRPFGFAPEFLVEATPDFWNSQSGLGGNPFQKVWGLEYLPRLLPDGVLNSRRADLPHWTGLFAPLGILIAVIVAVTLLTLVGEHRLHGASAMTAPQDPFNFGRGVALSSLTDPECPCALAQEILQNFRFSLLSLLRSASRRFVRSWC